jgi:hypothetical protein
MSAPLHTTKKLPPKGWVYRELIAGKWWSNRDPMLPFGEVVKSLYNAKINNKIKTTVAQCEEAIAAFTCNRLGGDTRWCVGASDPVAVERSKQEARGCQGCGRKKKAI